MKNPLKVLSAVAATAAMALGLSACGGGSSQASSDTITYWASDQGNSLDDTAAKLKPPWTVLRKRPASRSSWKSSAGLTSTTASLRQSPVATAPMS